MSSRGAYVGIRRADCLDLLIGTSSEWSVNFRRLSDCLEYAFDLCELSSILENQQLQTRIVEDHKENEIAVLQLSKQS
jgi:hypothetical protein